MKLLDVIKSHRNHSLTYVTVRNAPLYIYKDFAIFKLKDRFLYTWKNIIGLDLDELSPEIILEANKSSSLYKIASSGLRMLEKHRCLPESVDDHFKISIESDETKTSVWEGRH